MRHSGAQSETYLPTLIISVSLNSVQWTVSSYSGIQNKHVDSYAAVQVENALKE